MSSILRQTELKESKMPTFWKAFANCCKEECGLEPEKLVKVWSEPMLPEIEKLKNRPDPTEVDTAVVLGCEEAFKQMWNVLTGEG